MTVVSYSEKPLTQPDLIDGKVVTDEHMFVRMANWHHMPFQPNWIFYGNTIVKPTNGFEIIDEFRNFGFYLDTLIIRFNDDVVNLDSFQNDKCITSFEFLKEYTVNDKVYYDVIHVKSKSLKPDYIDEFDYSYVNDFEYWISKNNWIIKKVIN